MLTAMGFVPDIDSANAAEFDRAASENVFAFWLWAGSAGFVWLAASLWWAAVPAVVAIHAAIAWVSCTRAAQRLRHETSGLPNRNDGTLRECAARSIELEQQSSKGDSQSSSEVGELAIDPLKGRRLERQLSTQSRH